MKMRTLELSPGFRIFYYFSAIIGTLSTLFWTEKVIRQGVSITSIGQAVFLLWDLIEFVLTVSLWFIPFFINRKDVPISLIRLAPSLLMSSVALRVVLTLLFAAA